MRDLDEDIAAKGLAGARDVVAQTAARGRLDEDTATTIAASLSATTDLAELAGCDLVIEAVPEVLEIKRSVFAELESVLDADADRKSTRLNSSHVAISYAVFCL